MKILIISILGIAVGWMLAYGAFKTAEQIAKPHIDRIESFQ